MLLMSLVLMTVGYTMVYSVLHGSWEFWTYFFPKKNNTTSASVPVTAQ